MSFIAVERCIRCGYPFEEEDLKYLDLEGGSVCENCHIAEWGVSREEEW